MNVPARCISTQLAGHQHNSQHKYLKIETPYNCQSNHGNSCNFLHHIVNQTSMPRTSCTEIELLSFYRQFSRLKHPTSLSGVPANPFTFFARDRGPALSYHLLHLVRDDLTSCSDLSGAIDPDFSRVALIESGCARECVSSLACIQSARILEHLSPDTGECILHPSLEMSFVVIRK